MVTMQQVKNGIVKYIDSDLLPQLDGFKRIGLGVYSALAANNAVSIAMKYKDHPAVSVLGILDESGNVDIDKLYQNIIPMFANGEKQRIDIPMIGELRIDKMDIEKIYHYIKG